MVSTSSTGNTYNPAEDTNPILERYLPGLGVAVRPAYAMYVLDSFQLARLILIVEETAGGRRGELERLERQLIPLLNSIRGQLGKPRLDGERDG